MKLCSTLHFLYRDEILEWIRLLKQQEKIRYDNYIVFDIERETIKYFDHYISLFNFKVILR